MKKSRFRESQIASIRKQINAGSKLKDACREHGISSATYEDRRSNFGGMDASDLHRMRDLKEENDRLK